MVAALLALAALLAQQPPSPRPFPQPSSASPAKPAPPPPATPSAAAPSIQTPAATPASHSAPACAAIAPTATALGVPLYPAAQFIASYDAGRGQCFYLFGSAGRFDDVVTYYRNQLKQKGDLVFETPPTHEFEIGRFREETMAFPPTVTIKEYKSELSEGYPNKLGGQPARFPTVIQIVPATEK